MEQDRLVHFFRSLQDAFLEGRIDDIQDFFAFPVVIYSVAGVTLVRDPEALAKLTVQYRDAIRALGVTETNLDIMQYDPPKNFRMRTTVRFTDLGPDGVSVTGSVIRYFLFEQDGDFKIEMMEYLQEPLSPSEVEQIVH